MKVFPFDIEPYRIEVSGMQLIVLPMEDGVYRVSYQKQVLANLYPEITAAGVYWNGYGQISPLLAEEIGLGICACEI